MRSALVLIGLALAGVAALMMTRATREAVPSAVRTAGPVRTPDALLESLRFTPEQLKIYVTAGLEIQKGVRPSEVLTAEQFAAFAAIEQTLTAAVCPPQGSDDTCRRYRVDVPRCIERAAEIVAWRRRERAAVDQELFVAAMGVSVTGREFPTFTNLVRFCREMNDLDPARSEPRVTS